MSAEGFLVAECSRVLTLGYLISVRLADCAGSVHVSLAFPTFALKHKF